MPLKNWSDPVVRNQIINQVVLKEYIDYCRNGKSYDWKIKAKEILEYYGILLKESSIEIIRNQLKYGKRKSYASSAFKELNKLGSRSGKDVMYGQLEMLSHLYLKPYNEINYVGLPANQILYMIKKYGNVVACELNKDMYRFMSDARKLFAPNSTADIYEKDIFEYLNQTNKEFSLFDFDLMVYLNDELIERIVNVISKTAENISIANIVSCIGRKKTELQYKNIMPNLFLGKIREKGFKTLKYFSGGYVDNVVPMKYEFFVIERL